MTFSGLDEKSVCVIESVLRNGGIAEIKLESGRVVIVEIVRRVKAKSDIEDQ